jgi:DNA-3-methyladenine glycosylase I
MTEARSPALKTAADVLRELTRLTFHTGIQENKVAQYWPAFELAFLAFEPAAVATFGPAELERLYAHPGLIRHRSKLSAVVSNARTMVRLTEVYGGFSAILDALATETYERRAEFMRSTFTHVGPTIAYKFLRLAGLAEESDDPRN